MSDHSSESGSPKPAAPTEQLDEDPFFLLTEYGEAARGHLNACDAFANSPSPERRESANTSVNELIAAHGGLVLALGQHGDVQPFHAQLLNFQLTETAKRQQHLNTSLQFQLSGISPLVRRLLGLRQLQLAPVPPVQFDTEADCPEELVLQTEELVAHFNNVFATSLKRDTKAFTEQIMRARNGHRLGVGTIAVAAGVAVNAARSRRRR